MTIRLFFYKLSDMDTKLIKNALKCGCPKCGVGPIFPHKLTLDVKDTCPSCGLNIKKQDSGDGPAVFLIFILGFILTPLALWLASVADIPLWLHAIIWTFAAIIICIFAMQPLKAYVMGLNYKYRGEAHGV